VTVISNGIPHEVTTFRRDIQTDGRHAVVAFSTDVAQDAARRDFTMNALYADRMGNLVDPLGGLPDAQAGIVRFVGDPAARIVEDYLRILRFFRFFAHYGDPANGMDAEGLAACARFADNIGSLSRERIGAEMRKLLSAKDPAPAVASMAVSGVLAQSLPGADPRYLAILVHLEAGIPARWMRRLAIIGAENPAEALRLSRAEQRDFRHIRAEMAGTRSPAALGWTIGAKLAEDVVLCRSALFEQPLPKDWQADILRGAAAVCPVSAIDFQDRFSGPALGRKLKGAQQRWLASDLTLTRKELLL
jgi:poly(A) polymerase